MVFTEFGITVISVAQQCHQLAEEERHQGTAATVKTILSPAEAFDCLLMSDYLRVWVLGHPFFEETSVIIMGVGQEDIADLFEVSLLVYEHTP